MILSSRSLISLILYLLYFKKSISACLGSYKNGCSITLAISIASSTGFGLSNLSDGSPYLTWNLPLLSKKILSILPTKWEKFKLIDSSDANMLDAELPDAVNVLPKNSNGDLTPSKTVYAETFGLISIVSVLYSLFIFGISLA